MNRLRFERRAERWWGFRRVPQVYSSERGYRYQLWLGHRLVQFDWVKATKEAA